MTPLHLAARNGHIDVCRLIMKNVWNKNPKLFGATPRKLAYENDHMEIYEFAAVRPLLPWFFIAKKTNSEKRLF